MDLDQPEDKFMLLCSVSLLVVRAEVGNQTQKSSSGYISLLKRTTKRTKQKNSIIKTN